MDPLEEAGAIAEQIIPLAEKLLANHQPGAALEDQPEFQQIRALYEKAHAGLRKGLQDSIAQLRARAKQTHEKAASLRAKQQAALVPKPAPPPLLALEFEAKYAPAEALATALLHQLAELPPRLLSETPF
jgi:hypothetical protein